MIYGHKFLPENYINESVLFNSKDFVYNLDKFEQEKTNILFITGYSGGGKSYLSRELAKKYNVELVEYDVISFIYKHKNKIDKNSLIGRFFSENVLAKKYLESGKKDLQYSIDVLYPELMGFIQLNNYRCIVEGMQVFMAIEAGAVDENFYRDYAMIIKGTSAIKSSFRAIKRDFGPDRPDNYSKPTFEKLKSILRRLKNMAVNINGNEKAFKSIKDNLK